jgi:hypothetical protein
MTTACSLRDGTASGERRATMGADTQAAGRSSPEETLEFGAEDVDLLPPTEVTAVEDDRQLGREHARVGDAEQPIIGPGSEELGVPFRGAVVLVGELVGGASAGPHAAADPRPSDVVEVRDAEGREQLSYCLAFLDGSCPADALTTADDLGRDQRRGVPRALVSVEAYVS